MGNGECFLGLGFLWPVPPSSRVSLGGGEGSFRASREAVCLLGRHFIVIQSPLWVSLYGGMESQL